MSPLIEMFVSRLRKIYKGTCQEMKGIIETINRWDVRGILGESFTIWIMFVICKSFKLYLSTYVCGNSLFVAPNGLLRMKKGRPGRAHITFCWTHVCLFQILVLQRQHQNLVLQRQHRHKLYGQISILQNYFTNAHSPFLNFNLLAIIRAWRKTEV